MGHTHSSVLCMSQEMGKGSQVVEVPEGGASMGGGAQEGDTFLEPSGPGGASPGCSTITRWKNRDAAP